jgi:signal transduction histidine kinase
VEDDGAGFDGAHFATPDGAGHGWGLLGMRERVEMLGGTLQIDSALGEGTHLALRVPLP